MGFQKTVGRNLAFGVVGDFYTTGPWTTVEAGPDELTAGPLGVIIGRWAWADDATGVVTNAKPASGAVRNGFVGRAGQRAVITGFMDEATMTINKGFEVTLYKTGSYMVKAPVGGATIGQAVFASTTTGELSFAAKGATVAGSVELPWAVCTAGVAGDIVAISDKGF